MIFLIEYDRRNGRLVQIEEYHDQERSRAERKRLEIELDRASIGIDREVVLLDASDEKALRRTHGRYFQDVVELAEYKIDGVPLK